MKTKRKPIRQGDIILYPNCRLRPIEKIPDGGERVESRELTVALGEATGHHHTLYPTKERTMVTLTKVGGREFLDVGAGYFLRHQEHEQHSDISGSYEILREEEYCPFDEQMKKVVD